jgi:hypothetical protein
MPDRRRRSVDGARYPAQLGKERIVDAYRTIFEACRTNGEFAGIGGVYEEKSDAPLRRHGWVCGSY